MEVLTAVDENRLDALATRLTTFLLIWTLVTSPFWRRRHEWR